MRLKRSLQVMQDRGVGQKLDKRLRPQWSWISIRKSDLVSSSTSRWEGMERLWCF